MKEHITPEVGDVWAFNSDNTKFVIINVLEWNQTDVETVYQILYLMKGWYFCEHMKMENFRYCTYLGKSKANIDDLFKTENE